MFYLTEGIQEGTFTVFFLFFNNGGTFPPPRVHEVLLHCYFCPFSRPTRKAVTLQKTWLGWSDGPEAPLIRMFQEGQQHGDVRSCDQTHTRQEKKMLNIHTERHQMADQQSSLCLFITSPMTLFQLRLETVHEQIFYFPANTWCPTPDPHKHMITLLTSTEHCLTVLCISYIIQTKMHKRKVQLVVFYWCILWTVSVDRDTQTEMQTRTQVRWTERQPDLTQRKRYSHKRKSTAGTTNEAQNMRKCSRRPWCVWCTCMCVNPPCSAAASRVWDEDPPHRWHYSIPTPAVCERLLHQQHFTPGRRGQPIHTLCSLTRVSCPSPHLTPPLHSACRWSFGHRELTAHHGTFGELKGVTSISGAHRE